ncbi:hypothetical protein JXA63_00515 [Candidatus Woesebacteria bacterium]|nr:hypothetical protein [Candidatus Woesebacteria bacterium]
MQNSFQSLIEAAGSILVLLPKNPTLDQVASGLSLYLSLSEKKSVNVTCPTPMTVDLNKLVGVNKISEDLGNKNLLISFTNYQANDIERVSYDIEDKEFMLSVIPKAGLSAPSKDQINITYSGISSDLVILVGGVNEDHFPALSEQGLKDAKKVHIGIRQLTFAGQYQMLSFVQPFSSIAEVVANLLIQAKFKIDADVSTNLIAGIEQGSGHFTTQGVAAETFQLIYELMRTGGKRVIEDQSGSQNYPPGSIPGQIPQSQTQQSSEQKNSLQQQTGSISNSGVVQQVSGSASGQKSEEAVKNGSESSSDNDQNPPKDWLEPKIYKGSSVDKG